MLITNIYIYIYISLTYCCWIDVGWGLAHHFCKNGWPWYQPGLLREAATLCQVMDRGNRSVPPLMHGARCGSSGCLCPWPSRE